MDNTLSATAGQSVDVQVDIRRLTELVQLLRAWWESFEGSLRKLDRVATAKAHDIMVEANLLAREISRQLGFALPDYTTFNWSPSIPSPYRPASEDL